MGQGTPSGSWGPNSEQTTSNRISLKPGPGPTPPSQPPTRKAILQARQREGVFLPKKIRQELEDLEVVDEAKELPKPGSYFGLLSDPQDEILEEDAKELAARPWKDQDARPSVLRQRKGANPKQIHWEESSHRKERPWVPWHIKHEQRERNPGGKTDAQLTHESRNATVSQKASAADKKRKGGNVPWFVKARQERRAQKQQEEK